MNTPVLLIIYNRPEKVEKLISALAKIKPQIVYIFCDGPKNISDKLKVSKSRDLIKKITWTKRIKTKFLDKNKGCKNGVNTAIDWFFKNVESGIILEDDCIPNKSFFKFTSELLERYKTDKRISIITGFNSGIKLEEYKYDYYFSIYGGVWGWASWRNRWQEYRQVDLGKLISSKNLLKSLIKKGVSEFFVKNVRSSMNGEIDTWDYMWTFYNMTQNRLSIVPQKNLISNIGFGKDATHTKSLSDMSFIKKESFQGKLKHPPYIVPNYDVDSKKSLNHNRYYQIYRYIKSKIRIF